MQHRKNHQVPGPMRPQPMKSILDVTQVGAHDERAEEQQIVAADGTLFASHQRANRGGVAKPRNQREHANEGQRTDLLQVVLHENTDPAHDGGDRGVQGKS